MFRCTEPYTQLIDRQVGPRTAKDREAFPPNNILLTLAGAGLVWMGWTGFNGGAPYSANIDASLAVVNTHLCAATSLLVWLCLDCLVFGRPSVIGAVQGMITGLVCITPGAGTVHIHDSVYNHYSTTASLMMVLVVINVICCLMPNRGRTQAWSRAGRRS